MIIVLMCNFSARQISDELPRCSRLHLLPEGVQNALADYDGFRPNPAMRARTEMAVLPPMPYSVIGRTKNSRRSVPNRFLGGTFAASVVVACGVAGQGLLANAEVHADAACR